VLDAVLGHQGVSDLQPVRNAPRQTGEDDRPGPVRINEALGHHGRHDLADAGFHHHHFPVFQHAGVENEIRPSFLFFPIAPSMAIMNPL